MIRQKKGEGFGMSWVVILVLIGASLLLLYPLLAMVITFITGQGESSGCTLSLYKGRHTAECPIGEVKINSEEVVVNGEVFMETGSRTPQDMAKEALAKLLQTCLTRGGGLNSQAFYREGGLDEVAICMECFHVTLDGVIVSGLTTYLDTNKPIGTISDRTYMQILTRDESYREAYLDIGSQMGLFPRTENPLPFVPGEDYTVFFLGIKKGGVKDWFDRLKKVAQFEFKGAIFENSDTYFTFISESEKIVNVCDRKVN